MGYHIISIAAPQCSISCKDGQLTCRTGDEKPRTVPIEDVASIIITSFSASLHSKLLLEASRHGVALIICEEFKPACVLLPANRSTDTLLTRAVITLPQKTRSALWQKTVDAKCGNQLALAEHLVEQHGQDESVMRAMRSAAMGKKPHKEAVCAKLFWHIAGRAMEEKEFTRDRGKPGLNALLNYGYAVLLSTVLQKIFSVGLDPTFGISHAVRERATPLAYDLMEPFRPCVDWRVFQWARQHLNTQEPPAANPALGVTQEFRKWVTAFPLVRVDWGEVTLSVEGIIEGVVRGFRRSVLEHQSRYYRPWTQKNSKWAG